MRVIISTELSEDNYTQYKVVRTFAEARELKDDIEVLIIHKFEEEPFVVGVFLSEFYEYSSIKQYVCIANPIPTTIKVLLKSVNGICYEDEFYFEDEAELTALIEEDSKSTELVPTDEPLKIIKDFMQGFVRGEARINTPVVLKRTQAAIQELQDLTNQQHQELIIYSKNASEIFKDASNIIRQIDVQKNELIKKIDDLEKSVNNASVGATSVFSSEINIFNPHKYTKSVPPLVLVREITPCRYLTSFMLSYAHYLHFEKNRRVKLIFVVQKSHGVYKKYEDFVEITQDNYHMKTLYDNDTVFVSYPTKEVLRDLLDTPTDIIFVVDRLYGKTDIIDGKVHTIYAASSVRDAERFNKDVSKLIIPIEKNDNVLLTLPTIKGYPDNIDARFAAYAKVFHDTTSSKSPDKYNELDVRFGVINS